ncbi:MAG: GAF domain-containing protein [Prevotellaceae bacterium]|jgi:GAF domain-containing protein|nr:GAF domain-containing protein [Prevotellaceae bacterium]
MTRENEYKRLLPSIKSLLEGENDEIANMANIAAVLKETFGFWWVGFYRVLGDELLLGPFQGPVACTRIKYGRGVCGSAWMRKEAIIVPDVELFEGHIACSAASKSEIVIPLFCKDEVLGVLDIDSAKLNDFDEVDEKYLTLIVKCLH